MTKELADLLARAEGVLARLETLLPGPAAAGRAGRILAPTGSTGGVVAAAAARAARCLEALVDKLLDIGHLGPRV